MQPTEIYYFHDFFGGMYSGGRMRLCVTLSVYPHWAS